MASEHGEIAAVPDRIAIDADGYGWRTWYGEDHWSMVPTNPDNEPVPEPVTWFVPAELLGEVVDWLGVPDWSGPQLPADLGRRIATALGDESGGQDRGAGAAIREDVGPDAPTPTRGFSTPLAEESVDGVATARPSPSTALSDSSSTAGEGQ